MLIDTDDVIDMLMLIDTDDLIDLLMLIDTDDLIDLQLAQVNFWPEQLKNTFDLALNVALPLTFALIVATPPLEAIALTFCEESDVLPDEHIWVPWSEHPAIPHVYPHHAERGGEDEEVES